MKYSFRIGSVWNIPIELHFTFLLLILAVFILSLPTMEFYTFSMIVFLFIFVAFHELAHSVVARRYGIKVRKIVLYPIGGVSEIEEISDNPSQEWRMAIAGPLTSLSIGFILLAASLIIWPDLFSILLSFSYATGFFLFDLAILNILLGTFNLIPAFPMDGGRVFRAILAERIKYADATRYAVTLGRILGILMVISGFIFYDYFLLIIVGMFVYIGASEEGEQTIISTKIADVRVRDVMQLEVGFVNPEQNLTDVLEVMFKNRYHDALVIKDGLFEGIVTWNELMKIGSEQRNLMKIEQMPLKRIFVYDSESILEANKIIIKEKVNMVPVVKKENPNKVIGVLTGEAIVDAYNKARNR